MRFFFYLLFCALLQVTNLYSDQSDLPSLWINRFDRSDGVNEMGGSSGAWNLDPSDNEQWYEATYDEKNALEEKGYCLRLEYDVSSKVKAQGGYWTLLNKANLSQYDTFEFYVKKDSEKGGANQFKIQFKKSKDDHPKQKLSASFVVHNVTDQWQKVSIPLNRMTGISNWHHIEEMVIVFEDRRLDVKEGVLYFDDFRLVRTGNPGPGIYDWVERKTPKKSNDVEGKERAEYLIKRLGGFPQKVAYKEEDLPEDDQALIQRIAKDTWRYFDEMVDQEFGLVLDNVSWSAEEVLNDKTFIGDYTNVTNIGLYLMCIAGASELDFISKEEAVLRLKKTIQTIQQLEHFEGFLYNYYDTTTGDRTSNFVSLVDSGWLTIGLIVARNAFPELKSMIDPMIDQRNFSFFYDDVEQQMFHGYYVNVEVYAEYHYGVFYTEPRATSFMSIGKGDVPLEHWFKMFRTFPNNYDWQNQVPINRTQKMAFDVDYYGGHYEYQGIPYWPSWGGSTFEALMPTLVLKEKELAPKGLGLNDLNHAKVTIDYTLNELKFPVWGMSPSSVPGGGYSEFGVQPLGNSPYPAGIVTPHATFLVMQFMPKEAIQNLRQLLKLYPTIYGEYGFYDSVNVENGLVEHKYMALDQGMSFLALVNVLKNGMIRQWFHKDPIAKNVEKLLTVETLIDE